MLSHTTGHYPTLGRQASAAHFRHKQPLATNWTVPSTVTLLTVVDLTLTVRLSGVVIATKTIQVVVRAFKPPSPLALPAYADQTGATGNIVDLTIASATDGRAPYSYAYADLPEELGAIGRRIRGRLITPGVETVTVTVTDANGDTATVDVRLDGYRGRHSAARGHQRPNRLGALILCQRSRQRNAPHPIRDKCQERAHHQFGRPWPHCCGGTFIPAR